jgi:hypothetical protein
MEHDIGIWFLLLGIFFPRFVLFFWWLTNNLPYNTTPFAADVICSIFLPRILILVYIYGCMGFSPWFWIHLVAALFAYGWHVVNFEENMKKAKKFYGVS